VLAASRNQEEDEADELSVTLSEQDVETADFEREYTKLK